MHEADADRIERATGRRPIALEPAAGHGAPSNRRWVARFADGTTAFAKIAAFDYTADWLRVEHTHYRELAGHAYIPRLLGWDDDGIEPALVIEDLSDAFWPPPWSNDRIDAVMRVLDAVAATEPPPSIEPPRGEFFDFEAGWVAMRADPTDALGLGVFDDLWLQTHIDGLITAAASASTDGSSLVHRDVRSDNLCFRDGDALLVDWNVASRGAEDLDLASWLPSLRHEGGPEPWTLLPDAGPLAALLAGFFLQHAGGEPIPQAPHVRQLQLDQGVVALRWACRELGIPEPA